MLIVGQTERSHLPQYYKGGYEGNVKHEQRELVADFLLSFIGEAPEQHNAMKLLSLPGENWSFEHMIMSRMPRCNFIGLERNRAIFLRAARAMPGVKNSFEHDQHGLQHRVKSFGNGSYFYYRVGMHPDRRYTQRGRGSGAAKRSWRSNRFLNMDLETFLTVMTTDYGATLEQKREFHYRFYGRNAAWLDFTSQLCPTTERCLANLPWAMDVFNKTKPVVITVMAARDGIKGMDARVARMLECQPLLQYIKHWTYKGKNDTPMLTLCATLS